MKCPTCGQDVPAPSLPEFEVGARVQHIGGAVGTVTAVEPFRGSPCVIVRFDGDRKQTAWSGAYNANWFLSHPCGLTLVTSEDQETR